MIYYHIIIRFLEFRPSNQGNRVRVCVCVRVYGFFIFFLSVCTRVCVARARGACVEKKHRRRTNKT